MVVNNDHKCNVDNNSVSCEGKKTVCSINKLRFAANSKVRSDRRALEGQRALNENFSYS